MSIACSDSTQTVETWDIRHNCYCDAKYCEGKNDSQVSKWWDTFFLQLEPLHFTTVGLRDHEIQVGNIDFSRDCVLCSITFTVHTSKGK